MKDTEGPARSRLGVGWRLHGDGRAPRFVGDGRFPWHPGRRARVVEVRQIGDVVLTRYALSDRCEV